jgi:excisionase family DNA binding protein
MADEREILTPQQAAEFLQVPVLTVQRQAKAGRLPGRRVGKEWRFSRTGLLEWMGAGPDRHDLELFNRKSDREEQAGEGEDDEAEAE